MNYIGKKLNEIIIQRQVFQSVTYEYTVTIKII